MIPVTTSTFRHWLDDAAVGENLTWYTGYLARERRDWNEPQREGSGIRHEAVPGLDQLARAVAKAVADGEIVSYQKRLGHGRYSYIARRARRRVQQDHQERIVSYGRRLIVLPKRKAPQPKPGRPVEVVDGSGGELVETAARTAMLRGVPGNVIETPIDCHLETPRELIFAGLDRLGEHVDHLAQAVAGGELPGARVHAFLVPSNRS